MRDKLNKNPKLVSVTNVFTLEYPLWENCFMCYKYKLFIERYWIFQVGIHSQFFGNKFQVKKIFGLLGNEICI